MTSDAEHLHVDVVLDEVTHNQVVADFGKVQSCVLVLGLDVAIGSIL